MGYTSNEQRLGRADRTPGHCWAGECFAWWRELTGRLSLFCRSIEFQGREVFTELGSCTANCRISSISSQRFLSYFALRPNVSHLSRIPELGQIVEHEYLQLHGHDKRLVILQSPAESSDVSVRQALPHQKTTSWTSCCIGSGMLGGSVGPGVGDEGDVMDSWAMAGRLAANVPVESE